MEQPAPESLEGTAGSRPTPSDRKVVYAEGVDQLGDVGAFDLVVGGQGDDGVAGRLLEPRHDRRGLAELASEPDHGEPLSLGQQLLQALGKGFARAVEHEDHLVGLPERIEASLVLRIQTGRVGMAAADRHDDR